MLAYAEQQPEEFQLLARAPYSSPDDDPLAGRRVRSQLIEVLADNYRRESRNAGTPIDDAAEILAHLVFAMVEELILLRFDDPTWNRDALADFASSFIDAGISGAGPKAWSAADQARTRGAVANPQ